MLFLGLDTSSTYLSLALVDQQTRLAHFCQALERDHAKHLLSELDKLLAQLHATPKDLKAIAVGTGPGSYTGLRVGLASAKALAKALNIPLYGFPSLEAMISMHYQRAESKEIFSQEVSIFLEAHRGQVYLGSYRLDEGSFNPTQPIGKLARGLLGNSETLFEAREADGYYLAEGARAALAQNTPPTPVNLIYL